MVEHHHVRTKSYDSQKIVVDITLTFFKIGRHYITDDLFQQCMKIAPLFRANALS